MLVIYHRVTGCVHMKWVCVCELGVQMITEYLVCTYERFAPETVTVGFTC